MALSVVFRWTAEEDLGRLYCYIRDRRDDPEIAIAYVRRVRSFCFGLTTFPSRGRLRDDLGPGLRVVPFDRRCIVCFRVDPEAIVIVRVFYGGRDYERILRGP